jgi:hypothetical protein
MVNHNSHKGPTSGPGSVGALIGGSLRSFAITPKNEASALSFPTGQKISADAVCVVPKVDARDGLRVRHRMVNPLVARRGLLQLAFSEAATTDASKEETRCG